jgi:hypothetical protein
MRGIRVDGVFVSGRNYCGRMRVARKEYRKEAGSFTLAVRVARADLDDRGCDNHPNAASAKVGSVFHPSVLESAAQEARTGRQERTSHSKIRGTHRR